jgi:phenylacetate-CoA ligase
VLTEFLDGEEEVAAGEKGAVVCTGLKNYAMPLIRYKDEDIAIPLHEDCSCGVRLPMLKGIEGRESDMLMALDGCLISPWNFFPFPFEDYDGIMQFRIIQDRKDRVIFQMIIDENAFAMSRLEKARVRIQKLFGEGMHADFQFVSEFKKERTGKMRAISRLF